MRTAWSSEVAGDADNRLGRINDQGTVHMCGRGCSLFGLLPQIYGSQNWVTASLDLGRRLRTGVMVVRLVDLTTREAMIQYVSQITTTHGARALQNEGK